MFLVIFMAVLLSCEGSGQRDGPCDLLNGLSCGECLDGVYTCAFGQVEVTGAACQGCQTRAEVWQELCDRGSTDLAEDVEAGTVCDVDEPL